MSKVRAWLLERGALIALAVFLLYAWLAPSHVVDGDNAEFASLSVLGGAAHPSGYPLQVLWLRATSWLPGATPGHTAALSTALVSALTILVLHAAARAWGARPLAATGAVAVLAAGPVLIRIGTEAEVFALNNLVVATVLWLSAQRNRVHGIARAASLGVVAGLGLSNHLTCVLVTPVGVLGVVRSARESKRPALALAAAVGGLVVGLLPYTYLLVAADSPMSWGAARDLDQLLHIVLRQDYGGPFAFRSTGPDVPASENLGAFFTIFARAWLWLPLLAVTGLILRRGGTNEPSRWAWGALAASWLLAGPLLVFRFNVPPHGIGLYVNQRFYVLPIVLAAIPVAVGASRLLPERIRFEQALLAALATVGLAAATAPSLDYLRRVHSPAVERSAQNLLRSLPPGAVFIHGQDEFHAVTGYVQWVLGERQDVVVVTWPLIGLPWYRERLARRGLPFAVEPTNVVDFVRRAQAAGRPVFADRLQRELIAGFPTHPYGFVIRVLPHGEPLPDVPTVFAINADLYSRFELGYPVPGPDDEFATEVHLRYAAIWTMIETKLREIGDVERAAQAREMAKQLAPRD